MNDRPRLYGTLALFTLILVRPSTLYAEPQILTFMDKTHEPFDRVLVIAKVDDLLFRKTFEDSFCDALERYSTTDCIASVTARNSSGEVDLTNYADAAVVTIRIDVESKTQEYVGSSGSSSFGTSNKIGNTTIYSGSTTLRPGYSYWSTQAHYDLQMTSADSQVRYWYGEGRAVGSKSEKRLAYTTFKEFTYDLKVKKLIHPKKPNLVLGMPREIGTIVLVGAGVLFLLVLLIVL